MNKKDAYKFIRKALKLAFGYCPPMSLINLDFYFSELNYVTFTVGEREYELSIDDFDLSCISYDLTLRDFYGYGHDMHMTLCEYD